MSDYDLVLHVGMPRSGAVIRRALTRLRPQLRMHRVAYIGDPQIAGLGHVAGWECGPHASSPQASTFDGELATLVAAERRHAAGVTGRRTPVRTIVSSNRLLGAGDVGRRDAEQFRPYAIPATTQVIKALSARRVQVVLYTQRQDRLMELSYLQRMRTGRAHAFEDEFPDCFEPRFDYLELIDRLRTVPAVADVVVRPLELVDAGQHAFVNEFLGLVGLENRLDLDAMGLDPWPYPPGYSARGARLALALTPLMDTPAERRRLRGFVWENYSTRERYDTDFLDRDVRRGILDSYAELNRELFRTHLPDLPVESYSDDPSTFALGNVLGQPSAPPPPPLSARLGKAASAITRRVKSLR
jgi:hypothetical protein